MTFIIHWWARYRDWLSLCHVWWFYFQPLWFYRADRQTDRQNHTHTQRRMIAILTRLPSAWLMIMLQWILYFFWKKRLNIRVPSKSWHMSRFQTRVTATENILSLIVISYSKSFLVRRDRSCWTIAKTTYNMCSHVFLTAFVGADRTAYRYVDSLFNLSRRTAWNRLLGSSKVSVTDALVI